MRHYLRSERVKLKNVHRVTRNGAQYKYHRVTREPLPLLPEDHPELLRAWAAEESKAPPTAARPEPGTLAALWDKAQGGPRFQGFSPGHQKLLRLHGNKIATAYGKAMVRALRKRHISADLEALEPHAAKKRLKTWRFILDHTTLDADPTAGIKLNPPKKTAGFPIWTPEEVERFRAHWPIGTLQRRAFELLSWTGARCKDAVALSPSQISLDGFLTYRQTKTANPAHVPWTSALPDWAAPWAPEREMLHAAIAGARGFTFLETEVGLARSAKGLGNLVSKSARDIKIEKSAHGLRKFRLTRIAEAGGSTQAIMSWGGHVSLAEAEHYTREANRKLVLTGGEQRTNRVNH